VREAVGSLNAADLDAMRDANSVWVDCSGGRRYPGLVVAWRRTAAGWEAYVAILREGSVLVTWEKTSDLYPVRDEGWSKTLARSD
jgi:hypothetical protein